MSQTKARIESFVADIMSGYETTAENLWVRAEAERLCRQLAYLLLTMDRPITARGIDDLLSVIVHAGTHGGMLLGSKHFSIVVNALDSMLARKRSPADGAVEERPSWVRQGQYLDQLADWMKAQGGMPAEEIDKALAKYRVESTPAAEAISEEDLRLLLDLAGRNPLIAKMLTANPPTFKGTPAQAAEIMKSMRCKIYPGGPAC